MFGWLTGKTKKEIPAGEILSAFDPWTLACAVGVENGTIGSSVGFESWLRTSRKNWMPRVKERLPNCRRSVIETALRGFVKENSHKPYDVVLAEEDEKRGNSPSVVLPPGESRIRINLSSGLATVVKD